MLHDLNIVWTPQTAQADLVRALHFSKSIGYDVVALNHIVQVPIPAQPTNPIPQLGRAHPAFPPHPTPPEDSALPTILRRATILIADPATNHRLPTLAATYDVLAARPTTDKAFTAACTTMSEISLISLDLSVSQPFRFKPKPCMAAVHRGVLFEVCYGQLLHQADVRARANFIANVLELVRATKGRGLVLSSEGHIVANGRVSGVRAPADVVNLMACWGLGSERGMESLNVNPRLVVFNEGLKRRSFRGVVDIVQAEGRIPAGAGVEGEGNGAANKQGDGKQQQPKKVKIISRWDAGLVGGQDGNNGNAKRKSGDVDGGETSLPVLSKRQVKKQKLAAKQAAGGAPPGDATPGDAN